MLFGALAVAPRMIPDMARPDLAAVLDAFPLRKGARWVFEGEAEWTAPRGRGVRSGRVRDVMEVLEVRRSGGACAAIVRGFPLDMAWYRPGRRPGLSVLLCRDGRIFERTTPSLEAARTQARVLLGSPEPPEEDPFLDLPLREHKAWGRDQGRPDARYCWVVDDPAPRRFAAPGVAGGAAFPAWCASFRTNPDQVAFEFAPGLGITAFSYEHHGAVARTRLRLVSHRPGS
jgi:hypothetical protein